MGLLDYGRDDVDRLVQETAKEFYGQAVQASSTLAKALTDVAKKKAVDANYLWFTLYKAPASWKSLLKGKEKDALEVAVNLALKGRFVPNYTRFSMPDEAGEQRVNEALAQLGKWALSEFRDELGRRFRSELRDSGQELVKLRRQERMSLRDAQVLLWTTLDSRVLTHSHWFTDHLTLWQILHKLFRK